jgi:hypothetical protein
VHRVVLGCGVSLTGDEMRFKLFEKLFNFLTRLLADDERKILARALGRGERLMARPQDFRAAEPFL